MIIKIKWQKKNGINVIRINCFKSEWNFIKNNIMNSNLPNLLGFKEEDIDWIKCHELACKNLVKVVCDYWNNGINNTSEIMKILKISRGTVIKYLKQGVDIGWCNYDVKEVNKNKYINNGIKLKEKNSKQIVQLTLDKLFINKFISMTDAAKQTNINQSSISNCCRGKSKTAGGYRWMYYEDYIKTNNKIL